MCRHLSGQAGSGSGAGGAAGAARPAATAPAVAESESHRIAALASDAERYRASVVLPLLSAAVEVGTSFCTSTVRIVHLQLPFISSAVEVGFIPLNSF